MSDHGTLTLETRIRLTVERTEGRDADRLAALRDLCRGYTRLELVAYAATTVGANIKKLNKDECVHYVANVSMPLGGES